MVEIAYDGSHFSGFAMQPNKRTVERELDKYLSEIYGEKIRIIKSSRTDNGVHALKYIFAFDSKSFREFEIVKRFIEERIEDVRINKMWTVSSEFHPQFDAESRIYEYRLYLKDDFEATRLRNYQYKYLAPINKKILKELTKIVIGEHDFASFTAREKYDNTIKTVTDIRFSKDSRNNMFSIIVEGKGFLRWMVRNIVGAMLAVNDGRITVEEFKDLIDNPSIGKASWKLPPTGLYKVETKYKEESLKDRKLII